MRYLLKSTIAVLTPLVFLPLSTLAAGIQVSPASLDFSLAAQKSNPQTLTVINPTADVQVFEVYADEFADIIRPNPASFTLESGARKAVIITIDLSGTKDQSERKLTTNLSVVGKPLADTRFSVATGAKIPIAISIKNLPQTQNSLNWILWLTPILGFIVILVWFYHGQQNRKT